MTLWFYSDPHFGQDFSKYKSGGSTRPFATVEEQDETMIERHNALVKPTDHVYCLGDFAMSKEAVERVAPRLHGHKRLILGNHDIHDAKFYMQWFKKLCAVRVFNDMFFTHIPIAPWSHGKMLANVHGHVHHNKPLVYGVANPDQQGFVQTKRYVNLSVEVTNYQPVSLEQVSAWARRSL